MKLITVTTLIYFMTLIHFSLAQNYIPMINTLNSWNIVEYGNNVYHTYNYCIGEKHTINDTAYHKIIINEYSLTIAYLREDMTERKVYVRYPDRDEILLYDFSLDIGDSIYVNNPTPCHFESANYYHLADIDTVALFNGEKRKRYTLEGGYTGYDIWIEGIGTLQGILYPGCEGSEGFSTELLCFYINDSLLYQNPIHNSCFVSDVNTGNKELSEMKIFPNPTSGIIHIDKPENIKLKYYNVYNSNGNIVIKNQMLKSGVIKLPEDLNGVLIIELITIENQKNNFKIYKL